VRVHGAFAGQDRVAGAVEIADRLQRDAGRQLAHAVVAVGAVEAGAVPFVVGERAVVVGGVAAGGRAVDVVRTRRADVDRNADAGGGGQVRDIVAETLERVPHRRLFDVGKDLVVGAPVDRVCRVDAGQGHALVRVVVALRAQADLL